MTEELIITKPDDMHLHLREGETLKHVVMHTAKQFARAIVMPNLESPVTTVTMANRYCQEIKKHIGDSLFNPLMTLYFNDSLDSDELKKVRDSDNIIGIKLYPAGVTTNSKDGVSDFKNCLPIFKMMEEFDIPLLIHGEVSDKNVDIFDR